MSDLEDGEILDSSDEEMKNGTQKEPEIKANIPEKPKQSPDLGAFTNRQDRSSRVAAIKSAESSGYRSNTPDTVGSDSSHDSDSEEDTPLWKQKKAKYFRSQKEQRMAVCASPTLPEYKPQSPQAPQEPQAKKRRNDIWGSVLLEQDITQSMVRSGQMVEKDDLNFIERNVESYHRDVKKYQENVPDLDETEKKEIAKVESNDPFSKVMDSYTSKISRSIVDYEEGFEDLNPGQSSRRGVKRKADVKERLGAKSNMKHRLGSKSGVKDRLGMGKDRSGSRFENRLGKEKMENQPLGEIDFSADMEEAELSKKIAEYLHEAKVEIIERVISVFGKEETMDLVCKTRDVEDAGGLMTHNRDRRRTPGGVFITLMKNSPTFTSEVNKIIFKEDIEEKAKFRKEMRQQNRLKQKERLRKLKKGQRKRLENMQQSAEKLKQPNDSKSQTISKTSKERPRSWSTESEASSSEDEMDTGDKRAKNKAVELDFQAELEKTKQLIVRSKSKENTDCTMEDGQDEGMKEGKSIEALPEDKENMEDSGMNDLLEEESNVIDIPLGDE